MTAVPAVTDGEQTPWRPGRLGAMLEACTCWDRYDHTHWATCPIHAHLYNEGQEVNPTTRDLLDAAVHHIMDRDTLGLRPAKAKVHAMPLTELVGLPPVRRMLYDAANKRASSAA